MVATTSLSLRCRNKYQGTITSPPPPSHHDFCSGVPLRKRERKRCSCASCCLATTSKKLKSTHEWDNGHIYRNNILQGGEFMGHGRSDIYQQRLKHIGPPPAVIELYRPGTKWYVLCACKFYPPHILHTLAGTRQGLMLENCILYDGCRDGRKGGTNKIMSYSRP